MMTSDQRILVPIDLHQISRNRLETLVNIANLLHRSVLGLLLEDLQLQQVADLPFTTEITLSGGRERSLLRDHLSQRYKRINADTREALKELAANSNVEVSFEQASGHRMHCAMERSGDLDIFFAPRQQWQHGEHSSGRTALPVRRLGLVLPSRQQSARVMTVAATLLKARLVGEVQAIAGGDTRVTELASMALPGQRFTVRTDIALSPGNILLLIRRSPYDLMLIPRSCLAAIPATELDAALALASGQILVVGDA